MTSTARKTQVSTSYYRSKDKKFELHQGDSFDVMETLEEGSFDMIFADPPYFLSNDGVTCKSGRMVSVNKGKWDKSKGADENHAYNREWLEKCQRLLTDDGTIWISGTQHVIFSIGFALQQLGFKILNDVSWFKVNPPPNLSCRYFTHSTETVIWAAKNHKSKHKFNYQSMKQMNGGKQMKSLWNIMSPRKAEKQNGKHPTQKPLQLLERIVLASTEPGDRILDPFNGSGTTGVTAALLDRQFVGIEMDTEYLELTKARYENRTELTERLWVPEEDVA